MARKKREEVEPPSQAATPPSPGDTPEQLPPSDTNGTLPEEVALLSAVAKAAGKAKAVALVGHDPQLTEALAALTKTPPSRLDFRKGADTHERLGPLRVTQAGLLSADAVLRGAIVCFVLAASRFSGFMFSSPMNTRVAPARAAFSTKPGILWQSVST